MPTVLIALSWMCCGTTADVGAQSQKPVDLAILEEPLQSAALVTPGHTYVDVELINVFNHQKKAWFTSGDSRYVVAFEVDPAGADKKPQWKYAVAFDHVGSSGLSGVVQNVRVSARPIYVPAASSNKPVLAAHILELDRANDVTPALTAFNDLLAKIPTPYTAAATAVLSMATDAYSKLVDAWIKANKENVELRQAGFDFLPPGTPTTLCGGAGAINPMIANCVYVLMDSGAYGDVPTTAQWIRANLRLSPSGKQLVFKAPATFKFNFSTETKKVGDVFDLKSYLLFRFVAYETQFTVDKLWEDKDLRTVFQEAQQIPQVRTARWKALAEQLTDSFLISRYDIILLRAAWDQYMAAADPCKDWDVFWNPPCFSLTQAAVAKAATDNPGLISPALLAHGQSAFFADPASLAQMTDTLKQKQEISSVQKALSSAGFQTTDPPGHFGDDTKAALKSFQLKNGLPSTGTLDITTIGKLKKK
jgi:hypothetical protein